MAEKDKEEFKQSPVTLRAVKVYWLLIKDEKFKTQEEFCKQVGIKQSQLSFVINGKRNFALPTINMISKKYKVHKDYLYDGKGPIFFNNVDNSLSDTETDTTEANDPMEVYKTKVENDHLKKEIELLREIIEVLKSKIEAPKTKQQLKNTG